MTKPYATRCALLLFGCWGAAVDVHAQNLLKNGSFELPGNLPGNFQQTYQGSIGDWHVAGGVEIFQCPGAINSSHGPDFPGINYCPPSPVNEGSQYLNLSTGSAAKVWQTVQTTKNALYYLRFMIAAAKDPSAIPTVLVVASDGDSGIGNTLASMTVTAPASHQPDPKAPKDSNHPAGKPTSHNLVWTEMKFTFRAISGSTTIAFSPVQLKSEDASFIDNVRLDRTLFEVNWSYLWFLGPLILGVTLGYFIIRKRARAVLA